MLSCGGREGRHQCGGSPRFEPFAQSPKTPGEDEEISYVLSRLKACEDAYAALSNNIEDRVVSTSKVEKEIPSLTNKVEQLEKRLEKLEAVVSSASFPMSNAQVNVQVQVAGNKDTPGGSIVQRDINLEKPNQVSMALTDLRQHAEYQAKLQEQLHELQSEMDKQADLAESIRSLTKSTVLPTGWENEIAKMKNDLRKVKIDDDWKSTQSRQLLDVDNCVQQFIQRMHQIQTGDDARGLQLDGPEKDYIKDDPTVAKQAAADEPCPEECGDVLAMPEHLHVDCIECSLKGSTWEIACLVFEEVIGFSASVQIIVLLILTIVGQVGFTAVCLLQFTSTTFNEDLEDSYANFRLNIAHDARYVDVITQQSFAQRLCDRSDSLELGAQQLTTLQNIDSYRGTGEGTLGKIFAGPLMCTLALACWGMTVFVETRGIIDFIESILILPREAVSRVVYRDDSFIIESMSTCRRLTMITVLFLRLTFTFLLLFAGGMFLAVESSVPNLLLNNVALEFVLHIDQLVFEVFALDSTKKFVDKLEPLRVPKSKVVFGIDLKTSMYGVLTVTYILVFIFLVVLPMTQSMTKVEDALCAKHLAFSYTSDTFGFIYLNEMANGASQFMKLSQQTIREAILNGDKGIVSPASVGMKFAINPATFGYSLGEMQSMPTDDLVELYNSRCRDVMHTTTLFDFKLYVHYTMNVSVESCADLSYACLYEDTKMQGIVSRWMCPQTCGCESPFSLTRSNYARDGCPDGCTQSPVYLHLQNEAACEDWPLEDLKKSAFWPQWMHYLERYRATYDSYVALNDNGCDALRNWSLPSLIPKEQLCFATGNEATTIRPLAIVCPLACRCNNTFTIVDVATRLASCPGTCPEVQTWKAGADSN